MHASGDALTEHGHTKYHPMTDEASSAPIDTPHRNEKPLQLMAVCGFGLESVLARELKLLGFDDAKPAEAGCVRYTADHSGIVHSNLWLRIADRVLVIVDEFEAADFDALFEGVKASPWADWMPPDAEFPVRTRCVRSQLSSVPAVTRAVKRGIVEALRTQHGVEALPETGPMYAVQARLLNNQLTLMLDTSGTALHKRGYRREGGPAPLRETLAAAMIRLAGWKPERPLIDPFCGSGTLLIEAALIATNRAPGLERGFDSEAWHRVPGDEWERQREHARSLIKHDAKDSLHLAGYDIAPEAIEASRRNAERAGVGVLIHFQQRAFEDLRSRQRTGTLITNPPYGIRLSEQQAATAILRTLPVVFRHLPGWSFNILSSDERFEHLIGQDADKKRKLYNGSIECVLYRFDAPSAQATQQTRGADRVFGALSDKDEQLVEQFAAVFAKRWRHFRGWPGRGLEAHRLYNGDVPAVRCCIDRFGDHLVIRPPDRFSPGRSVAQQAELMDRVARQVATIASGTVVHAPDEAKPAFSHVVHEHGVGHTIELPTGTGLDFSLRELRRWLLDRAEDAEVLELMPADAGIAEVAAAAEASRVVSPTTGELLTVDSMGRFDYIVLVGGDHEDAALELLHDDGTLVLVGEHARRPPGSRDDLRITDATRRFRCEDLPDREAACILLVSKTRA